MRSLILLHRAFCIFVDVAAMATDFPLEIDVRRFNTI